MVSILKKNLSIVSFIFIPTFFLWHPNWIGILGIQPYWPLFWLLPWSMINGSANGLIVGLILGLVLDSISLNVNFTQIPGLILCGLWFGRFKSSQSPLLGHIRYGLICSIGSFLCGLSYFLQIVVKNIFFKDYLFFFPSFKIILAQVFLTGFFAPFFCSQLFKLFKKSKNKSF